MPFRSLFKKKKKKSWQIEKPIPTIEPVTMHENVKKSRRQDQSSAPAEDNIDTKMSKPSRMPSLSIPRIKGKFRIPGLRTAKRLLGGILLIVNFACFLAIAPIQEGIGFFFLLNGFILIDYLWKTRKVRVSDWKG